MNRVIKIILAEVFIFWQVWPFSPGISYAANESFVQTDWSGGQSATNAVHPTNKTGWNKYSTKQAGIDASQTGKLILSTSTGTITETSDAHFNAGTLTNTEVVPASGAVKLKNVTNDKLRTTLGQWGAPAYLPKPPYVGAAACYPATGNFVYILTGNQQAEFLSYNFVTKEWSTLTSAPNSIGPGCSMAYPGTGDFIYVMRGNYSKDFWKYSITNDVWTAITNGTGALGPVGPGGSIAVYSTNIFYVTAGNVGTGTAFYEYTLGTNTWAPKMSVFASILDGGKLIYPGSGNYIYCLRGGSTQTVYRWNKSNNQWLDNWTGSAVTVAYPVSEGATFTYGGDGYFYLTFGDRCEWKFYRYAFGGDAGNVWTGTAVANMAPFPLDIGTAAAFNATQGKIYFLPGGGYKQIEMPSFGIATQRWSHFNGPGRTDQGRGYGFIKAGNYIYSVGYADTSTSTNYNRFYRFELATEQWQDLGTLPSGTATYYPDSDQLLYSASQEPDSIFWICEYGTNKGKIYKYSISGGTWSTAITTVADFTYDGDFCYPGTGRKAYILSGDGSASFYEFDLQNGNLTALASLPTALSSYHGCATYVNPAGTGYIFVLRGRYYPTLYRYTLPNGPWDTYTLPANSDVVGGSAGPQANLIWPGGASNDLYVTMCNSTARYKVSISNPTSYTASALPQSGYASTQHYPAGGSFIYFAPYNSSNFYRQNITTGVWTQLAVRPYRSNYGWLWMPDPAGDVIYYMVETGYPTFVKYTISTNTWSEALVDLNSSYGFGSSAYSARIGDYIYALAGGYSRGFYRYSMANDKWEILRHTPHCVGNSGGYLLYPYDGGDYIYATAGDDTVKFMRYSISGNSWVLSSPDGATAVKDTPGTIGAGACMAAPGDGNIYLLRGGSTYNFYRYNISGDSWQNLNNSPQRSSAGTNMIYTGDPNYIYILLCYSGTYKDFYKYPFGTDAAWTNISAAPYPRANSGYPSFTYDGSNYIYSLDNNSNPYLYRYNISSPAWEQLTNSPLRTGNRGIIQHGGPNYSDFLFMWRTPDQQNEAFDGFKYSISENKWDSPPHFNPTSANPVTDGRGFSGYATCVSAKYRGKNYIYVQSYDYGNSAYYRSFWQLDTDTGVWTQKAETPLIIYSNDGGDMMYPGTGDYIYAMPGNGQTAFWRYSIPNNTWEILNNTPATMSTGACLAYSSNNGYIYATRGANTQTVYRYYIQNNQWISDVPNVGANVYYGGSLVYVSANNSFYCLRGYNSDDFYKWTVGGGSWTQQTDMPGLASYGTSLIYPGIGSYVYALLGNSRKLLRYHITNLTWEELTPPPNDWCYGGKMVYSEDGNLYYVKGQRNSEPYIRKYNLFASGEFTSQVLEIGPNLGFGIADWTTTADNATTTARVSIRSFNQADKSDAPDFSAYATDGNDFSGLSSIADKDKYLQYKVELKTLNTGTLPEFRDIALNYLYYPHDASLTSSVYDSTQLRNRLMKLSWTETLPTGTDARFQMRTSDTGTWGGAEEGWLGPTGTTSVTNNFSTEADYAKASTIKLESGAARLTKELEDFAYKQAVTVDNTGQGALVNAVVPISIPSDNNAFWSRVQSDGDDIRFYDASTSAKLAYCLTSFNYTDKSATLNVKIPSLGAGEVKTIYMLYSSTSAASESDSTVYAVPMDGMVGWWRFDEVGGSTAADSSGSNNTGTLQNGATFTAGKVGNGVLLDGNDDRVYVSNSLSMQVSSDMTIAFWLKPTTVGSGRRNPIHKDYAAEYSFTMETGGSAGVSHFGGSGGYYSMNIWSSGWQNNVWRHCAVVRDHSGSSGTVTSYIDGAFEKTQGYSQTISAGSSPVLIGTGYAGAVGGIMDEVFIYNRVLTADEISQICAYGGGGGGGTYKGTTYLNVVEQATTSPTLGANWPYREVVTAANTGASALTNHQLRVTIDKNHTGFWAHAKNDGSDIRFVDSDNTTVLTYWLESFDYANQTVAVWVKIPSITAATSKSIYLYYGNAAAASTSSSDNMTIPMDGIVGYWRMDEGTGATAYDSAGKDNNGSLVSGYGAVVPDWTEGRFGKALMFAANNDAVSISDAANMQPATECTISAWFKASASTGGIFAREYSTGSDNSYMLSYWAANTAGLRIQGATDLTNATFLPGDTWYHLVGVKRGTNIYLFKNGAQVNTVAAPATIAYTAGKNTFIGSDDNNNDNRPDASFSGIIDNVIFYNRGLTDPEITRLYQEPTYSTPATYTLSYTETANAYFISPAVYPTSNPTIQPIYGAFYNDDLAEFLQTPASPPAGTAIKYQVSHNGYEWYYWNGSAWTAVTGGYAQANTATEVNTNLAAFMSQIASAGEFFYRAYLHSDTGSATPSLDNITINVNSNKTYYITAAGTEGINSTQTDAADNDRYFQYRVTLYSSGEATPILDDMTVEYVTPYLTISSPVGGEVWSIATPHNITWTTNGLTNAANGVLNENVKIEYSANGGTAYDRTESAATANDGTYSWTVDDDHTPQAKVKISSLGWSNITTASPSNFRIVGSVTLTRPTGAERWVVSTPENITWTSTGTMPKVKIEYSRNSGGAWSPVIENEEGTANDGIVTNDGSFSWTIPDETTTADTCLIRVSDSVDSNTVSTLATPFRIIGQLNISYPALGTDLVTLQTYNVTWTTKGPFSLSQVDISYTTDGGTSWRSMTGLADEVTTVSNTNTYSWNVPNPLTTNAKIRVTDHNDSTVYNISPIFNVRGFQITAPNGAEEWEWNSTHDVTWSSTGTILAPLKIYLSTDGGSTYPYWLKQLSSDPKTWQWIVDGTERTGLNPYVTADTCRIKIVDNAGRFDISDADFRIMANPEITMTAPVSSDEWIIGTSEHNIIWTNIGNISEDLTIEYTTDGGTGWTAVDPAPTPEQITARLYPWTIPDVGGVLPVDTQVRVREVTAPAGRDTQSLITGTSQIFKIMAPTFTVTAPATGTIWVVGDTTRTVTWVKQGTIIDNVKLDYSTDGGTNWTNIDSFTLASHPTSYDWTDIPPAAAGASVLLRISDSRTPANVYDNSDAIQILGHERITLTKPEGEEMVVQGDTYNVTWVWDGQATNDNLTLRLSTDGGATWPGVPPYLIESGLPNSPATFAWSVPNSLDTTHAKLRIYDPADDVNISSYTGEFTITLPIITVTAPAAGDSWYETGTYDITWTTVGSVGLNLKIEYCLNGGTWELVTAGTTAGEAEAKSKSWKLPLNSAGSTCQIRITDNNRTAITGTSGTFNIIAPSVTLTSPSGVETGANAWVVGTQHEITWTSAGGSAGAISALNFKYTINGTSFTDIDTVTDPEILGADSGAYMWTVDDAVSTTAQIKATDLDRTATTDTSAQFEIASPSIVVTSPDLGTESWIIGTQHDVSWYGVGSIQEPLKMYYTTDGSTWNEILEFDGTNDGTYTWTIPNAYAPGTAKVKITDDYTPPRSDASDKSFSIALPTIAVDTPDTAWSAGDTKDITWVTTGTLIGPLKVEWSTDNFISTNVLSSTVDKDAVLYSWPITNDAISGSVRLRVTDVGRTQSWGKSNAFPILPSPEITITSPTVANTGVDSWRIGKQYTITWTDNGGAISNDLKLQYSVDNGVSWTDIVTGEANDGSYDWTVPVGASATTSAKVRIYDNTPWKTGTNLTSDSGVFEIAIPRINITSPAGGETWAVGDSTTITWTTDGFINENLTLQYSPDNGASWYLIASGGANDGTHAWTVPDEVTTTMKIRIIDASSNYGGQQVTATSGAIIIIAIPSITIGVPNGNEIYILGDTVNITWTWKGLSISNDLIIEISNDNFVTKQTVMEGVPNTGSYTWSLGGATMTGSTMKLRVTDKNRTIITDTSDGYFRVRGGFTVTAPNGGENWGAKSPQPITWSTRGNIPQVKIEYSADNGVTWNVVIASVANVNSYSWTLPDVTTAEAKVRITDSGDDTVTDESNAVFNIVYFTVKFNILDYDTLQHLADFAISEPTTGWAVTGQSSPITRTLAYPYGTYSTFLTKSNYIDNSVTWSPPTTGTSTYTITAYMENSASAQVTWDSILTYSYAPADDNLNAVGSLQRKGKLVGTTELERQDMGAAVVTIYEPDGATIRKTLTATTPNTSGTYSFTYTNTDFEAGRVYPATLSVDYRGRPYISSANIDVGAEILQYEFFTQTAKKLGESVTAIEAAVAGGTSQTRADIEASRQKLVGDLEDTREEIAGDIATSQTAITGVLSTTETAIKTRVDETKAKVETGMKTEILNTESTIKSGDSLTIRYRTHSGLSPTIDVYSPGNTLELSSGKMTEIKTTGIYEYTVTFASAWGKGDFTIVCSESTKGTLDALILTVISTDLEQIAGQVAGIMGTTSSISSLKNAAQAMSSQFSVLETALTKMSKDLVSQVKEASGSVSAFESVFSQLSSMASQIKEMAGESSVNLTKLYEVSSDKKNDMTYLKNKTQELKAAMEINMKMMDNVANRPVTQTWYEYK